MGAGVTVELSSRDTVFTTSGVLVSTDGVTVPPWLPTRVVVTSGVACVGVFTAVTLAVGVLVVVAVAVAVAVGVAVTVKV